MKLREIAHARAGDKGNGINVGIIAYQEESMNRIGEVLTEERIRKHLYGYTVDSVRITRHDGPGLFNITIRGILNGGVCENNALDRHGRGMGDILLEMEI